jgi:primosomal protein N' (replication factor Y)
MPFAHVALPLPVAVPYSYSIPPTLADRVVTGARVVVPVRRREMVGIVVGVDERAPEVAAKPVLAAPDREPALTGDLLRTADWIAGYYGCPLGIAIKAMLPAPLWGESEVQLRLIDGGRAVGGVAQELIRWLDRRQGAAPIRSAERALKKSLWAVADRLVRVGAVELDVKPPATEAARATQRALELAEPRLSLLERQTRFARAPKRAALYQALEAAAGPVLVDDVRGRLAIGDSVIQALVADRLVRVVELERIRDPFAELEPTAPPADLTPAQRTALDRIEAVSPGDGALVFGVTGSGKTLVYLEAIRRGLERGLGAIILVPEIGLTPQTVARVRGAFGDRVAVLHSALSDGERADAWRLLRRGERTVAVGPRSAVFAPIERLGFVVIDEEHEATYKNGEAPRYHAREVAKVRSRLAGARLLLGSATPSLETTEELAGPRLTLVSLPDRVGLRPLPPVELIDLRTAPRVPEVGSMPWSEELDGALRRTVARGEQALLLLNRRGYAAFLQCPTCGAVRMCEHCSISLTIHRNPPELKCHYCGHREPFDPVCRECGHPAARSRGLGTQQVEQVVAERIPRARIARMDLDTTGTKWSHHRILSRVAKGEVDVLVGTQMVAKGIDFPNVTLVGVIDADTGLHLPDFRAAERTFQLITQVAGRAGRGPKGGRVIVQTWTPDHPALQFAMRHDTEGFWRSERAARIDPPYPPETSLVNVLLTGTDERPVIALAGRTAEWFHRLIDRHQLPVQVLGPAPCPIGRIKDRYRWHVVLRGPSEAIGRVVRYAAPKLEGEGAIRLAIDRDPVSLL